MKTAKRFLAALLCLVLCLSVLPAAFAQETLGEETVSTEAALGGFGSKNGWEKDSSGKWTFYKNNVQVKGDWVKSGSTWFYIDSDGYMVADCLKTIDGAKFYFRSSGAMSASRWEKDDNYWMYFGSDGKAYVSKWLKSKDKWYYFDADGHMLADCLDKIDGRTYWFSASGAMNANKWYANNIGDWSYFGSDGRMYTVRWLKSNNKWYYFDSDGKMFAGDPQTDNLIKSIGGTRYWFSPSGAIYTNKWFQEVDSSGNVKWRYFDKDGYGAYMSWEEIGGKWYYFGSDDYMVADQVKQIGGGYYWFNASGVMQTNRWYNFGDGSWGYFGEDGKAYTSCTVEIDGKTYRFNSNGATY